MRIFGNEKTNLILTEKAAAMYAECDPLQIIEHEDGSYSLRGIEDRDGMTAEDVNRWLEELSDEVTMGDMVSDWLFDHAEEAADLVLDGAPWYDPQLAAWRQDAHDSTSTYALVDNHGSIDIQYVGTI